MSKGLIGRVAAAAMITVFAAGCAKGEGERDEMGMSASTGQAAAPMAEGMVEYTVIFKSMWTRSAHPFEYPEAGAVTGPHFSGLIGASHNTSFALFRDGARPTPGLERLSEEGRHSPLDEEIEAAVAAGSAGALFESGPLRNFADSVVTTVRVDPAHPMISVVAMIAPSPDWFTGASDINLMENGEWVGSRTVQLHAWDSGGDDGSTYKAPDMDANPKKPTMKATSRHFAPSGSQVPVATLTFVRK